MGWLGRWWHRSDHYDRFSAHLHARGLSDLTRITIASIAAVLSLDALATIWTTTGPQSTAQLVCALIATGGAVTCASIWAVRWPTRRRSMCFALLADLSIALISIAQSDPIVAMFTCTTIAAMAFYIALFHTMPLMIYNFAIGTVVGAVEGLRTAERHGLLLAALAYSIVQLLNLAVPFGVQVIVHVLGADAVHAERDQLTGLYTRRAFHRRAKKCLARGGEQQAYVVVSVIDLDRFKQINDNFGHSTGDDALVSVSRALRDSTDDTAIIGRSGGEEFVIADTWLPDEVDRRAQQLCDEIAALPFGITASIGTAGIHPAYRTGSRGDLLVELMVAADAAMYAAKRRGGNQAGHHEWPLPPPLVSFADDDNDYRDGVGA